jgi:NADH:ubiquinone oxidoreductase subunit E
VKIEFDEKTEERFDRILENFHEGTSRVLPALELAQEAFGAITPEVERYMADRLHIPLARLHEVLTFYHMFRKHPHGRYTLTVCNNLTCRLLGSAELLTHLRERLGIGPGETSGDGVFTIETAECLGACHQAPVFQIDGRFHGPLSLEEVDRLIDRLKENGKSK